jgi:hypothetical protein
MDNSERSNNMSRELAVDEKKAAKQVKPVDEGLGKQHPVGPSPDVAGMLSLQQSVGNQAVQRLIAQRSEDGSFELDEGTAGRINHARGGGQSLDGAVQTQMSQSMGHDFSGVRVHTSSEADTLNQELSARAFTTGQDIFFKQGEYNPGSSGGQELLAHELTHVVQQSTGQVGGGGEGMTVRPAGDAFEQEADAMAKQTVNAGSQSDVQMASDGVQREAAPQEEEMVQGKFIQREAALDEEELLQGKFIQREAAPEEEEMVQGKFIQREAALDEEELAQ